MLKNVPLFAGLTNEELANIERHAVTRNFAKRTILINEGDQTNSLYVIISGKVKIYCGDEHGKEIIIATLGPGEYFGEVALIDDAERSASVMTLEDSNFLVISKESFKTALSQYPEIAIRLIQEFTQRFRNMTDNIKNLALLDVYGRVAKTLLSMATEEEEHLIIHEKLTQQDIANRVGASREMVAKIMKDLTTGGYIEVQDKEIIIRKRLPTRY
jgi:CRP/FNR family cyclic AMP-dependent transcriptional regulator